MARRRSLLITPWAKAQAEPQPLTLHQVRIEYVRMLIGLLGKVNANDLEHTCNLIEEQIAILRKEEQEAA